MSNNVLVPVTHDQYISAVGYIRKPKEHQKNYKRLLFAVEVISDYFKKKERSIYTVEDVIFEVYRVYSISENMTGILSESAKKVVSYVYEELNYKIYERRFNGKVETFGDVLCVLAMAKVSIVPKNYIPKYNSSYGY
jgi:hypothetical protein